MLRRATIALATATLVIGFGEAAGFAVVSEGLRRAPTFIGVTQTMQGLGAIVGGLTAAWGMRKLTEVNVAAFGLVIFAVGSVVQASSVLGVVFAGKILCGFGLPWIAISILTLLQHASPSNLQGRIFSAFEVATTGPQTLSIAVGAGLIAILDYRTVLIAEGVVLVLAAILVRRVPPTPADVSVAPVAPAVPAVSAEATAGSADD